MGFPDDLSDVVVFKVHPAIGIARVSLHDEYYVFGRDPGEYKAGGLMRRQAVQFRIFAYGPDNAGLGELTPAVMSSLGISAVWSARVANRKIARLAGTPLGGTDLVISAEASSDDPTGGVLTGSLPTFAEGAAIPLGQITGTGLFIPPRAGVHRKTAGEKVPPYPALSSTVADTSGDGAVSVRLEHKGGQELVTIPACIVIAPQDFSPDVDPVPDRALGRFLTNALAAPAVAAAGNLHNQTARAIDEAALRSCTASFAPGFETAFGSRGEVSDIPSVFYRSGLDPHVEARELRVRYKASADDRGAVPGQLTSGLCSPWQGDFTACVGYWSENLPIQAYLDENTSVPVQVFRKQYADVDITAEQLTTGDDFNDHVDQVGVVRRVDSKLVEKERNPGDDIKS